MINRAFIAYSCKFYMNRNKMSIHGKLKNIRGFLFIKLTIYIRMFYHESRLILSQKKNYDTSVTQLSIIQKTTISFSFNLNIFNVEDH